jgi:hypothetical protein|uniref:Uncharacterized protein n=1 Tax=viral metagenome TaxID=1070528 RepID=A0A6C0LDA1_9ZZZZ
MEEYDMPAAFIIIIIVMYLFNECGKTNREKFAKINGGIS